MSYKINVCLLNNKCKDCKHNRPDPERYGDNSCFLNEDLEGKERYLYLLKLKEHFEKTGLQKH